MPVMAAREFTNLISSARIVFVDPSPGGFPAGISCMEGEGGRSEEGEGGEDVEMHFCVRNKASGDLGEVR
jgi:hypothetical protein